MFDSSQNCVLMFMGHGHQMEASLTLIYKMKARQCNTVIMRWSPLAARALVTGHAQKYLVAGHEVFQDDVLQIFPQGRIWHHPAALLLE